jgi:hypothetical protein
VPGDEPQARVRRVQGVVTGEIREFRGGHVGSRIVGLVDLST